MKTNEKVDAEINALHSCTQRLRQRYSAFGDDNVAAIGVQVCVLQLRLSMAAVQRSYTPANAGNEHQTYLYDQAVLACEWLHDALDEEPRPSGPTGWGGLCEPRAAELL